MAATYDQYEPPLPNEWVRRVVVGWALFMGGFGAWGWVADNGYTAEGFISATVSLFACVMLLNASVQMRRAGAKGVRRASTVWLMALALFGSWSGYSAHHAFEMTQADTVQIETLLSLEGAQSAFLLIFFLCSAWIDPWLMWSVEETEHAPAMIVEKPAPPQVDHTPQPKGSRGHLRSIAGGITGSLALAVAPGSQAHEPGSFATEPVNGPSPSSQKMTQAQVRNLSDPARATARLMIRQGQTNAAIFDATKVPVSTLKRWRRDMEKAA